jgi:hypothetical protein
MQMQNEMGSRITFLLSLPIYSFFYSDLYLREAMRETGNRGPSWFLLEKLRQQ